MESLFKDSLDILCVCEIYLSLEKTKLSFKSALIENFPFSSEKHIKFYSSTFFDKESQDNFALVFFSKCRLIQSLHVHDFQKFEQFQPNQFSVNKYIENRKLEIR
jgi:hypothetical protein